MQLVDFLAHVLRAHAQSLHLMSEIVTVEMLIQILERSGEKDDERTLPMIEFRGPAVGEVTPPLDFLEKAIESSDLATEVRFYVWSYPYYRAYIEKSIDLTTPLDVSSTEAVEKLINEARQYSMHWVESLPIVDPFATQFQKASEQAWLRFRADVLAAVGSSPLKLTT